MARVIEVARYLIQLAAAEEEPDYLTHLRLQKLLYYVQGWSLALRGEPMFAEQIEAWANGPVVRDLYPVFKGYGFQPIPVEKEGRKAPKLTAEEKRFVESVWDAYKIYSATSLREMTHKEAPWAESRNGLGPADKCDREITHKALRSFFSKQAA